MGGIPPLDERLTLAASLYEPCAWGADVGTDHAYLPCRLLQTGVCQRMIAADVSAGALANARETLTRAALLDRAVLTLADGLDALDRPCGCVSIMGMGGKTLAEILRRGCDRLHGAVLVLSAHTELPLVRQAVADIDYRIVREELCRAAGRFYVFWRAEPAWQAEPAWEANPSAQPEPTPPAATQPSEEAILYGDHLWETAHPDLGAYAAWRMRVAQDRLRGLLAAANPDQQAINAARREITFYEHKQEELPC